MIAKYALSIVTGQLVPVTAPANIDPVDQPVLKQPTFVQFNTPGDPDDDNMHLHLQIASSPDFAAENIVVDVETVDSQAGWMYFSGIQWENYPAAGITEGFYGQPAVYLVPTNLLEADVIYYIRYRGWDGAAYTGWKSELSTLNAR